MGVVVCVGMTVGDAVAVEVGELVTVGEGRGVSVGTGVWVSEGLGVEVGGGSVSVGVKVVSGKVVFTFPQAANPMANSSVPAIFRNILRVNIL